MQLCVPVHTHRYLFTKVDKNIARLVLKDSSSPHIQILQTVQQHENILILV